MQNKNLGLRRKTVKLVAHNPEWKKEYSSEEQKLREVFGEKLLGVEHIGSTAIPEIKAKPILDLMVGVTSFDEWETHQEFLEKLRYVFRRDERQAQQHILFVKGPDENRTHYLKLTEFGSDFWKEHIAFRDFLIKHPQYRKEYEELKESLFQKYSGSREPYTEGKKSFIERILRLSGYTGKIL